MIRPTHIHAFLAAVGALAPLAGLITSTWLRARRNEQKLDVLLRSLGIDPDAPTYELERVADGGKRDD